MSTATKVLYYSIVLVIAISLSEVSVSVSAAILNEVKGNCSCAGFASSTPDLNKAPLLSQSPGLVVKCDDIGETTCKNLCLALATATKAKGPEILCNKLIKADELKLSAFYKVCDRPWVYANMTAEEPLCCEDTKVKACSSTETATPNVSADIRTL